MDTVNSTFNTAKNGFNSTLNTILNNKYFVGFMIVATVLYSSLARPELPSGLAMLFEHPITKMIIYALIVLIMTQNLQVALVVAIAFYILMSMLREQRIKEGFIDGLRTEGFYEQQIADDMNVDAGADINIDTTATSDEAQCKVDCEQTYGAGTDDDNQCKMDCENKYAGSDQDTVQTTVTVDG